ncbi:UNVERIFIED_CONTAM: hypothetical protein GTU68_021785 [Idotea baltica]|nr:hypothetical protein [Idotea baltica]
MDGRKLNLVDKVFGEIDQALRTIHSKAPVSERSNPADKIDIDLSDNALSKEQKQLSARLMRINHAGEVAAQGLYSGQALMSKSEQVREQMKHSAAEENDHLNWCETRLIQLESRKSYLSPVWYLGSFSIGACAGLVGDKWSLGFVKETEDQVGKHIKSHLRKLPANDIASKAILEQMETDEAHHAEVAVEAGAVTLPLPIRKFAMPLISKIMTTVSARI